MNCQRVHSVRMGGAIWSRPRMTRADGSTSPHKPSSSGPTGRSATPSVCVLLLTASALAACTQTRPEAPSSSRVAAPGQSLTRVISHLRTCRLKSDPAFRNHRIVDERDGVANPRILVTRRGQETGLPRLVVQPSRAGLDVFGPLATPVVVSGIRSAAVGKIGC